MKSSRPAKNLLSKLARSSSWQKRIALLVVVAFVGVAGATILQITHAGTSAVSSQSETGDISAPATVVSDTSSSGGAAVKFGGAAGGTVLLDADFDDLKPAAPMPLSSFRSAFADPTANTGLTKTSVVAVPGRGNVIRQTIPPNMSGGGSGITANPPLTKSVDEASIQYDIRFASDFDWGWGGKLPGLGGAVTGTNPSIATGCNDPTGNAWSGRSMWITPGSYGSVTGSNEWIGYMYNYNKSDPCGDNQRTGKAFTKGTWHTIKQYYKLNTVSANGTVSADGIHRMWLDGQLVKNSTNFKYRNSNNLHINYLFFHIFRGGSTQQWWSSTPGVIDIDNLKITSP